LVLSKTLEGWLCPIFTDATWIPVAIVLLVLGFLIFKIKKYRVNFTEQHSTKLPYLLGIFIFSYGLLLVISLSFFDAWNYFDNRILSPIFAAGLILVICLVYKRLQTSRKIGALKCGLMVVGITIAIFYLLAGALWIANRYSNGQEYASREWKQSKLIQRVKMLPPGIPIYTNGPELIYILTGRDVFKIPWKVNPITIEFNNQYLPKIIEMGKTLRNKGGVLIYSDKIGYKWFSASERDLKKLLPLRLLRRETDGSIYYIPYKK